MSNAIFTVDQLLDVRRIARDLPPAIKPSFDELGRQFYLAFSHRRRMIDAISSGWTYRGIAFGNGRFVAFEPCRIEEVV